MRPQIVTHPDDLNGVTGSANDREPGESCRQVLAGGLCLALHVLFSPLVTELDITEPLPPYRSRLYSALCIPEPSK